MRPVLHRIERASDIHDLAFSPPIHGDERGAMILNPPAFDGAVEQKVVGICLWCLGPVGQADLIRQPIVEMPDGLRGVTSMISTVHFLNRFLGIIRGPTMG